MEGSKLWQQISPRKEICQYLPLRPASGTAHQVLQNLYSPRHVD